MVFFAPMFLFAFSFANSLYPSAGHVDNTTEGFQDIFGNLDRNGTERKVWVAKLQSAKSQCSWVHDGEALEYKYDWFPTDTLMRGDYWGYLTSQLRITTYWPALPRWLENLMYFFFLAPVKVPALRSQTCRVVDSAGEEFRVRRLGPFLSRGGFDWHKMKLEDPYGLRSTIPYGSVSMAGFTVMPVDGSGEILGNPPIHVHHANLGPNCAGSHCRRSSLRRVSQWHGDSQCSASAGGTACYATALPEGFGFRVAEPLRLDVDFNDVRSEGSPELQFWLETAISIAKPLPTKQNHELGTVILGVPFRCEWWKENPDLQRLYFVPPDQPSALWATARMPTSGTFVAGKLETHQHMFELAWVFTGVSPEVLGLNSDLWHLRKPWLPWLPKENGWSDEAAGILALKHHVRRNFEGAVQRCAEQPSCQKPPSLVWTLDRVVIENNEDRQMPWPTDTWSFEEGDQYTIVIIHKAMDHMAAAHPGSTGAESAQHFAITGHYIPKPGKQADYFYILPSLHADWAWYDAVDWFVTLANYGGSGATDAQLDSSLWLGAVCTVFVVGILFLVCTAAWCFAVISRKTLASMITRRVSQRDANGNHFRLRELHRKKYLEVGTSDHGFDKESNDHVAEMNKIMPRVIGSDTCV
jgi:hypothetical protein